MSDQFSELTPGLESPVEDVEDTVFDADYTKGVTRCLILQVAGVVNVVTKVGTTVDVPLQAGFNPIRVRKCVSSPTLTASQIKAGY
jgi:hypothetical protein